MCTVNWRLPTRALSTVKRDKTRTMMSNINARRMILIVCVLIGLSGCASEPRRPDASQSTRSRIGQIVDADTGQPIVGALVLNVSYLWPERGFGNFPVPKVFRDSAQALSDENGRFTITGPYDDLSWGTDQIHIFKAGYGPWRFRGQTDAGRGTEEAALWLKNAVGILAIVWSPDFHTRRHVGLRTSLTFRVTGCLGFSKQ